MFYFPTEEESAHFTLASAISCEADLAGETGDQEIQSRDSQGKVTTGKQPLAPETCTHSSEL